MYSKSLTLVLLATFLVSGEKLPASFKLCKRNTDLNNCLQDAIESALVLLSHDGLPGMGIPKLDPVSIPSLNMPGYGSVDIEQNYTNVELHGLSAAKVTNVSGDLDNSNLYFETDLPIFAMLADYSMNGRMLVLPFQGEGKCNYTSINLVMTHDLKGEKIEKNGETFLKINEHRIKLVSTDKLYIHFGNLFNGNQELSDQMHALMNENWQVIFEDAKEFFAANLGPILKDADNQIFSKVPMDAIFLK